MEKSENGVRNPVVFVILANNLGDGMNISRTKYGLDTRIFIWGKIFEEIIKMNAVFTRKKGIAFTIKNYISCLNGTHRFSKTKNPESASWLTCLLADFGF